MPLLLALSFFVIKYTLGFTYAVYPSMRSNLLLLSFDLITSGIISGISLGRFLNVAYKYKK